MIQELLYTSAPKGLKPGSRGFCTVLSTSGMPAPVATALESLSGYRPVYPPGDPQAKLNPVVYSHLKMSHGGRRSDVLSRVADYGLDYSQRTNKIAHHLVVDSNDRPPAGPAWLLAHPDVMRTSWEGEPHIVSGERLLPHGKSETRVCSHWKELTGDAGWAGVLSESFLKKPDQPAYIVFSPGMNLLPLIEEALALLPASKRWDVSFSTYFTKVPNGVTCNWRCVLADSPEAKESRRYVQSLRIDLTEPLGPATGGELVEIARTGRAHIETVQEPADATTSKAKSTPHETPPTAGAAPPIRVRDGRPVPIPRKRASNYPVGHTERSNDETAGSWFKWVIAITLLALLAGGGTVAIKTGWKPLSLEKASAAPALAENIISEPESNDEALPKRELSADLAQPMMKETDGTSTLPGEGMPMKPAALDQPPAQAAGNSMPADEKSPSGQPVAMKADEKAKPETPADGNKEPSKQEKQSPVPSREVYIHWSEAPPQLQVNQVYDIPLPDWITPDTAIVKAWCPTDYLETFKSTNGTVEIKDERIDEWETAFAINAVRKDNKNYLQLTARKTISSKDYSRVVITIDQSEDAPSLFTILANPPTFLNNETTNKSIDTIFLVSTPFPQPAKKWSVQLEGFSIRHRDNTLCVSMLTSPATFTYVSPMLTSVADVDISSVVDRSSLQQILGESPQGKLGELRKLKVNTQSQLRSYENGNKTLTSLRFLVLHMETNSNMRKLISDDIKEISSNKLNPTIAVDDTILNRSLITDEEWIDHLKAKKTESDKIAESSAKETNGTGMHEVDAAKSQSSRLGDVIKFCTAAKEISRQIEKYKIRELLISQECKNGDETKYVPIIVCRREAASRDQVSEE